MSKQRVYVASDANWVEQGQALSERFRYEPYGQVAVADEGQECAEPEAGGWAWSYMHRGMPQDDATSALHHFRNRDYSPSLGRWVQQDPMGYVDGMSLYEYVGGAATTAVDPDGLKRIVFAFEGLSGHSSSGESIVRGRQPGQPPVTLPKDNAGKLSDPWLLQYAIQEVIATLPNTEWKYYAQDTVDVAFAEARQIATKDISTPTTQPATRPTTGPATRPASCYHTIIIVGFSNGGHAAIELANRLRGANIKVDLGFTIDPVPKLNKIQLLSPSSLGGYSKPRNATRWINLYQNIDVIQGRPVSGAEVNKNLNDELRTQFRNVNLSKAAHQAGLIVRAATKTLDTEVRAIPLDRASYSI